MSTFVRGRVARGLPVAVLTVLASVLAWLNQSPWWGWLLVATLLVLLGATGRRWARGPALLQVGAWVLAAVLVPVGY